MGIGKWFLVYAQRDVLGGNIEDVEIKLEAATEDEAVKEAILIWTKKRDETIASWEERFPSGHPFKTAFSDNGPWKPCVIYKINL